MSTNINTILSWFKTGKKPTQKEFWDSWQSFWHKEEEIPQSSIENLSQTLNNKAEKSQFDSHNTDPDAHADSIDKKLDKGGYDGTAKMIDYRLSAIENPDRVLKFGVITITGLKVTIAANAFTWVLNRVSFLSTSAYTETITATVDGMYRTDVIVGNSSGNYEIIKGTEAATGQAATEPNVPPGKIKVGYALVFGSTIVKSGNNNDINLSGEIRLPAYPNTRNDEQISTNKVLTTDANGFLKLATIATSPAPYIYELIPDSHLPNTIGNMLLTGEFFIPAMCLPANLNNANGIQIAGQTINYATFVNSQKIILNVTTGKVEGNFSITCNNGLTTTKNDVLSIVLGTVYVPIVSNWTNVIEPVNFESGKILTKMGLSAGSATLGFTLNSAKNYSLYYKIVISPLTNVPPNGTYNYYLTFIDQVTNVTHRIGLWYQPEIGSVVSNIHNPITNWQPIDKQIIRFYKNEGRMYLFLNNVLQYTFSATEFQNSQKVNFQVGQLDIESIKYVEHN